jgi:hypothetical protein
MEHTHDSQKPDRPKVSVNEHSLLVAHSKSKKLAAIANKAVIASPPKPKSALFSGLKSESDTQLQKAQQLIDTRIHDIMNGFPEGRRTKLFTIRFGSVANIQALEIKAAFKLLDINAPQLNMRELATLNYHGDSV